MLIVLNSISLRSENTNIDIIVKLTHIKPQRKPWKSSKIEIIQSLCYDQSSIKPEVNNKQQQQQQQMYTISKGFSKS